MRAQSTFEYGPNEGQTADVFLASLPRDTAVWQALLDMLSSRGGGAVAQLRLDTANRLISLAGYCLYSD